MSKLRIDAPLLHGLMKKTGTEVELPIRVRMIRESDWRLIRKVLEPILKGPVSKNNTAGLALRAHLQRQRKRGKR